MADFRYYPDPPSWSDITRRALDGRPDDLLALIPEREQALEDYVSFLAAAIAGLSGGGVADLSYPYLQPNYWYQPQGVVSTSGGNHTLADGQVGLTPISVASEFSLQKVTIVMTSATAACTLRLGIYGDNAILVRPTEPLADLGTVSFSSGDTNMNKSIAISPAITLPAGRYWLACYHDSNSTTGTINLGYTRRSSTTPLTVAVGNGSSSPGANAFNISGYVYDVGTNLTALPDLSASAPDDDIECVLPISVRAV